MTIIYAATKGFLDDVAIEEVRRYEEDLYRFLEARAAGVPICHATGLLDEEAGIVGWSAAIHPRSPRRAAKWSGVNRALEAVRTLAPRAIRRRTTSVCPSATAHMSAF